jgi:hypothetical protein
LDVLGNDSVCQQIPLNKGATYNIYYDMYLNSNANTLISQIVFNNNPYAKFYVYGGNKFGIANINYTANTDGLN